MKKIGIIILLTATIIMQGLSRGLSAEIQDVKKQGTNGNKDENTKVTIGKDLLSFEESDSAFKLRVGNRGLNILESLEGPKFNFERYAENEEWNQGDNEDDHARRRNRFRGHWSGIEFGFNNYLTSDKSLVLPPEIEYMTLHSGKSCNFNINFSQLSLGLTRHIGFVTGLGFNWNNYRFDGNNNILKGTNGIIEELPLDPGVTLEKSKLTTVYLNLPFMLEIQIPVDNSHLNIAAGPIGAVKIGSHTKMVFQDGQKVKSNGDFSLNMLRYGATARIGYGNFQLYGTYFMTPLFRTGKGPAGNDLYPFEIGVAFTFND
jgi:Outer membrane protein beta-barrel domain